MGLSNDLSSEAGSLSCCPPNPHGHFQLEVCPGWAVCFTPRRLSGLSVPKCGAALPAPFSATLSPALSVCLCADMGPQGLLVVRLPAPFVPHSASSPSLPISAPPTGLHECLFFISLVSGFLAFQFSVSSGCARRSSVSTFAAILVLPDIVIFKKANKHGFHTGNSVSLLFAFLALGKLAAMS